MDFHDNDRELELRLFELERREALEDAQKMRELEEEYEDICGCARG